MIYKEQLSLSSVLNRIRHILKQYSLRDSNNSVDIHQQLTSLTEQLQNNCLNSQNIVKMMVDSQQSELRIKTIIWERLREGRSEESICKQYSHLKRESKQNYGINSSTNILIKEILENAKLVQEELIHLKHNITTIADKDYSEAHQQKVKCFSLYLLLRIAMDDTHIHFSQAMNELLFRMYILEESITLLLAKTQKVFQEISKTIMDQNMSLRQSAKSQKNSVKSALSESIEIYKRKQLKQQFARREHYGQLMKKNQIQMDYQMVRKSQKKTKKADNYSTCCFRF